MLVRNDLTIIGVTALLACSGQAYAENAKLHKHPINTIQVEQAVEDLLPQDSIDEISDNYMEQGSNDCRTPVWAMCQVRIAHHEIR